MDMIERVARALCSGDPDAAVDECKIDQTPDESGIRWYRPTGVMRPAWKSRVSDARRAIQSMRQSSAEMDDAGCVAMYGNISSCQAERIYTAMIDAALADSDSKTAG